MAVHAQFDKLQDLSLLLAPQYFHFPLAQQASPSWEAALEQEVSSGHLMRASVCAGMLTENQPELQAASACFLCVHHRMSMCVQVIHIRV